MKCMTVIEFTPAYTGIPLPETKSIGMAGQFVKVGDGILYPPPVYFKGYQPTEFRNLNLPSIAVIDKASVIIDSEGYRFLTAPKGDDDNTALIFLAYDQLGPHGEVQRGDVFGGARTVRESYSTCTSYGKATQVWAELLMVIPVGGKIVLVLDREHFGISWDGTNVILTRE